MRGLADIEMKRRVDLQSPGSLEEAISLAAQYESFEEGEGIRSDRKSGQRSAPVGAQEMRADDEISKLQGQM